MTAKKNTKKAAKVAANETSYGPWNPGISSDIPDCYLQLSTMFRKENVETDMQLAEELGDFCGLPAFDLVRFRPARLILHETLISLTADIAVPDGSHYEDLGINFRAMVRTVLSIYITPHKSELEQIYADLQAQAAQFITHQLENTLFATPAADTVEQEEKGFWSRLGFGKKTATATKALTIEEHQQNVFADWQTKADDDRDEMKRACYEALGFICAAIAGKRGRVMGGQKMIADMVLTRVSNDYGSQKLGEAIRKYISEAVTKEDYKVLPAQQKPVVLNVKGASASGKSTLRPLQRNLVRALNTPWEDFALISPDIWRKYLLNYDGLGEAWRYAGSMSGHELEIIDQKLDRYMAQKAARGEMPHLLIDRFRFDSFVAESERGENSKLLTRFGDLIYLFFMITPPEATVERAWKRGEKFGRYKAVDDLLDHNVEAFTGMPQLFFTWVLRKKKRMRFEFLDNSVALGERPRTVAFGRNGEMTILDFKFLIDIDRFRKINIDAQNPKEVYQGIDMSPASNVEFLRQCAARIPVINCADFNTGAIYARLQDGAWIWRDEKVFKTIQQDPEAAAGLNALCADMDAATTGKPPQPDEDIWQTLGAWGGR